MSGAAAERVFVDTNVLLYALGGSEPAKQQTAQDWLRHLWESRAGRLSWQVLHEFYANAGPKMKLPIQTARRIVRDYILWQPAGVDPDIVERAWHWMDRAGLSYWDALILASAERLGCRALLSEDFQDGRSYGSVRIVNPFSTSPKAWFAG